MAAFTTPHQCTLPGYSFSITKRAGPGRWKFPWSRLQPVNQDDLMSEDMSRTFHRQSGRGAPSIFTKQNAGMVPGFAMIPLLQ